AGGHRSVLCVVGYHEHRKKEISLRAEKDASEAKPKRIGFTEFKTHRFSDGPCGLSPEADAEQQAAGGGGMPPRTAAVEPEPAWSRALLALPQFQVPEKRKRGSRRSFGPRRPEAEAVATIRMFESIR
ncbi:unnamed protein product, partial [Phaeothamnion confervicola]